MDNLKKEELIKDIKSEWIKDINSITDNEELKQQSNGYMSILEQLDTLIETDKYISVENEAVIKEDNNSVLEDDLYILKRSLLGGIGVKHSSDEEVYVPEKMIRHKELEHGDVFQYIKDGLSIGRDDYKKVDKQSKDIEIEPNTIVSYDYCKVEYREDINRYICNAYYDNGLLVKLPQYMIIHDNDVQKFNLNIGDLISVAHMPDKSVLRVRWVYNTDTPPTVQKPNKHSYYKDKLSNTNTILDSSFEDWNIGIVGSDSFINNYIDEVEKRNGTVHHTDSDVKKNVENIVNQSDIIVIPIRQTSHAKAEMVKAYAKDNNKPFIILRTDGRTNFVNQVNEKINDISQFKYSVLNNL